MKTTPKLKVSAETIRNVSISLVKAELTPEEVYEVLLYIALSYWEGKNILKEELNDYVRKITKKAFYTCRGKELEDLTGKIKRGLLRK